MEAEDSSVDEDIRGEELNTLCAIFPEAEVDLKLYSGRLEVPVQPPEAVNVVLRASNSRSEVEDPTNALEPTKEAPQRARHSVVGFTPKPKEPLPAEPQATHYLVSHLPPMTLKFELPAKYPLEEPPKLTITSSWASRRFTEQLREKLLRLWTDSQDQVLFAMVDLLRSELSDDWRKKSVFVPMAALRDILRFDKKAVVSEFEAQVFQCEICQYSKRGSVCTQLVGCSHVFCTDCLQDYFTACVDQGYIPQVICPHPGCDRPELVESQLQELIGAELTARFVRLSHKLKAESNPRAYLLCPRDVCLGLVKRKPDDLLAVCPKCDFAFCSFCFRSWHGKYAECTWQAPPVSLIEDYINGTDEFREQVVFDWGKKNMERQVSQYLADKQFQEYLQQKGICQCPKCKAPIEKVSGCNKMSCTVCNTYFCFRCSMVLERENPYNHYGDFRSDCYQQLFAGTDIEEAAPDPMLFPEEEL